MDNKTGLNKVIKLELESPCNSPFQIIDGQSRICNWLYNHLLEHADGLKKEACQTGDFQQAKIIYSKRGLRNQIPALKGKNPFLKTVHSSPLKNAALRLSDAIQAHQKSKKGLRKGVAGWPKYRSWKMDWFSLYYDEPQKGFKVNGNALTLSLGVDEHQKRLSVTFQLKEAHLLLNQNIRNLRIVKEYNKYYAVFTVSIVVPEKKPIKQYIALDPNHKNLAYGVDSNGKAIEIESPHWLKKHDKKIDELKSKRDRCQRKAKKMAVLDSAGKPTGKEYYLPSRRWTRLNKTLERALHTCREQKKTTMYTTAHALCRQYDCIGIGDYAPQGNGITTLMRRAMNNRSLIGQFKEVLNWVATKSGKTFVQYNEQGTTRTCHACDYVVLDGLSPSIRKWNCPGCCTEHVRDENAAINGLRMVLRDVQTKKEGTYVSSVPSSGLVSVKERCAWRVLPSGVVTLRGGKDSMRNAAPRNEIESMMLSAKS